MQSFKLSCKGHHVDVRVFSDLRSAHRHHSKEFDSDDFDWKAIFQLKGAVQERRVGVLYLAKPFLDRNTLDHEALHISLEFFRYTKGEANFGHGTAETTTEREEQLASLHAGLVGRLNRALRSRKLI